MKYATRILVSVIAASKSQEFLLTVRRRFYIFISTTTQIIRPRRQVDVFSTTPYTTLTRSSITLAQSTRQTAKISHVVTCIRSRKWAFFITRPTNIDLWPWFSNTTQIEDELEMWANAQRDGRPAEYRWRPLFNTAKFGWRPLLDAVQ